jgi:G:T-mismatch repair DNA endonuclease (very short patch repair protein)
MLRSKYEAINRDITRRMLAGEKRVAKGQDKDYSWSTTLDQAGYRVRFWRCQLFDKKHSMISRFLDRLKSRAGITADEEGRGDTIPSIENEPKEGQAGTETDPK